MSLTVPPLGRSNRRESSRDRATTGAQVCRWQNARRSERGLARPSITTSRRGRTSSQLGPTWKTQIPVEEGAIESNLPARYTGGGFHAFVCVSGHSRREELHEQESNQPAPSGSLPVALWTALPARQHDVRAPIVGLG